MSYPKEKMASIRQLPSFIPTQKFIMKEEGLKLKPYICSAGFRTVGWGHVIQAHDGIGDAITAERAAQLLDDDMIKAYQALFRLVHAPLSDNQQTALVSFIFNFGSGRFQASTLRQKINRKEFDAAAQEFGKWVYERHPLNGWVKSRGLISRRRREAMLFLGEQGYTLHPKPQASIPIKSPKSNLWSLQSSVWQKAAKAASACAGLFKVG